MSTQSIRGRPRKLSGPATATNIYLSDEIREWLVARAYRNQLSVSSEARALFAAVMRAESIEASHA